MIVETCVNKDLGNGQIGIVPTTSLGNTPSLLQTAKTSYYQKLTPANRLNWKVCMIASYLWILLIVNLSLIEKTGRSYWRPTFLARLTRL